MFVGLRERKQVVLRFYINSMKK